MAYTPPIIPMIKHGHMAAPALLIDVDRSVFKQSGTQRGAAYAAKQIHKKELRQVYGSNWKKHLNIPIRSIGASIKNCF